MKALKLGRILDKYSHSVISVEDYSVDPKLVPRATYNSNEHYAIQCTNVAICNNCVIVLNESIV